VRGLCLLPVCVNIILNKMAASMELCDCRLDLEIKSILCKKFSVPDLKKFQEESRYNICIRQKGCGCLRTYRSGNHCVSRRYQRFLDNLPNTGEWNVLFDCVCNKREVYSFYCPI
jgi:hypothetical protein